MIYKDKGLVYSEYIIDFLRRSCMIDEKKLSIKAETFYNCREQGYVLYVRNEKFETIYVWIYAHRNSDEPTIVWGKEIEGANMFTEEEWEKQKVFRNIDDAVQYTEEIICRNI